MTTNEVVTASKGLRIKSPHEYLSGTCNMLNGKIHKHKSTFSQSNIIQIAKYGNGGIRSHMLKIKRYRVEPVSCLIFMRRGEPPWEWNSQLKVSNVERFWNGRAPHSVCWYLIYCCSSVLWQRIWDSLIFANYPTRLFMF